jgi:hypothetical protein
MLEEVGSVLEEAATRSLIHSKRKGATATTTTRRLPHSKTKQAAPTTMQ